MRTYIVLTRTPSTEGHDGVRLSAERFSLAAALTGPVWALSLGCWRVALGGSVLLAAAVVALAIDPGAMAAGLIGAALAHGLLGPDAVRWEWRRQGWRVAGMVGAPDLPTAEHRWFSRTPDDGRTA